MYLLASGKKNNKDLQIEYIDGKFYFDGKQDEAKLKILEEHLHERPLFAGTYCPPTDYDDVNVLNVISNYYFDSKPKITAEDVTPMPHEEGVVY